MWGGDDHFTLTCYLNSNNDVIVLEISKSSLHTQLHLLSFSTETERRQTKCLFDHQNKQKK